MKAVAVPYIVAIILGVVVIGLLGYWFFIQGGKATVTGSAAECDAKVASYCLQWKNSYPIEPTWTSDSKCEDTDKPNNMKCKDRGISIP